MKSKAVFIVLNWNGAEDTIDCVSSILTSSTSVDVIIVDNASTDNSVTQMKKKFPKIVLLQSQENRGYAAGNNIGIRYALQHQYSYIGIMNNDVVVEKRSIELLIKHLQKNTADIVAPVNYNADTREVDSVGGYFDLSNPYPFRNYSLQDMDNKKHMSVEYVTGSCFICKRSVFETVGLLDEDYFMYVEDMDFFYKVKQAARTVSIIPSAKVFHKISSSTGGEGSTFGRFYVNRNKFLFYKKSRQYTYARMLKLLEGSITECLSFLSQRNFKKAYAVVLGTIQGLRI